MTADPSPTPTPAPAPGRPPGTPPGSASAEGGAPEGYWNAGRLALAGLILAVATVVSYMIIVASLPAPPKPADPGPAKRSTIRFGNRATLDQFNTQGLAIPAKEIRSGGPAKDGIPSLITADALAYAQAASPEQVAGQPSKSDPEAVKREPAEVIPISQMDVLPDGARVVGLTINGVSRAYPFNVLLWHEVVNDVLGQTPDAPGVPIAVTYCPLCDSVSVMDRRLDGKTYEFGVSGLLHHSNMLMYDRTDEALWSQVGMRAVSGPNVGRSMEHLGGWEVTSFLDWKTRYPDSTIVSFRTGHIRAYDRNPYVRYLLNDELRYPVGQLDDRLPAKTPVIGVLHGDVARAYPLAELDKAEDGITRDTLDGQPVVLELWHVAAPKPGEGPEDGRKRVSIRTTQVPPGAKVMHTFWFAWSAYHPQTDVYRAPPKPAR